MKKKITARTRSRASSVATAVSKLDEQDRTFLNRAANHPAAKKILQVLTYFRRHALFSFFITSSILAIVIVILFGSNETATPVVDNYQISVPNSTKTPSAAENRSSEDPGVDISDASEDWSTLYFQLCVVLVFFLVSTVHAYILSFLWVSSFSPQRALLALFASAAKVIFDI